MGEMAREESENLDGGTLLRGEESGEETRAHGGQIEGNSN